MNKQHWQTTLGGFLSSTGKGLAGIGMLMQLTQLSPTSNVLTPAMLTVLWYIALVGVVMGIVGTQLTAWFAADATTVNNIAAAVDQINQQGASPLSAPAATKPPTPTP